MQNIGAQMNVRLIVVLAVPSNVMPIKRNLYLSSNQLTATLKSRCVVTKNYIKIRAEINSRVDL